MLDAPKNWNRCSVSPIAKDWSIKLFIQGLVQGLDHHLQWRWLCYLFHSGRLQLLLINYFHPKTSPTCSIVNCSTGAGFFFTSFGTPKRNPNCSVLSFFHRVRGFYSCEAAVQCTLCHNNFIGLFEANRNSLLSTLFRSWAKHGFSPVCARASNFGHTA